MTDGDVWNSQNIIELVGKNANNTRLFSFGIGCGASTALVKGVARAGRGKAEFVNESEINKLPQKVNRKIPSKRLHVLRFNFCTSQIQVDFFDILSKYCPKYL